MITYEFSQFSFDPAKMELAAEASELGWKPGLYLREFNIHGKSTVTFGNAAILKDADGDVVKWVYLPVEHGGRFVVVVYND